MRAPGDSAQRAALSIVSSSGGGSSLPAGAQAGEMSRYPSSPVEAACPRCAHSLIAPVCRRVSNWTRVPTSQAPMRLSSADKLALNTQAGRNALGLFGRRTHPPAIIWVLTQRCFYRCVHCDSWTDHRPIDGAQLRAIADRIAAARTAIVALSGGEPFVVDCLPEIVQRLKRAGKLVTINTNGHLLEEHADWLVAAEVDHLQVSVDGHEAGLHDRIRRHPGSFDRILRGIAALKAKRRGAKPQVSVCGVVMKENAAHVVELVDRFAPVADRVELQPLHDSPGLLATDSSASFAAADRDLVRAQVDALALRDRSFASAYYRSFPRFLFEPESMEHFAVDHCLPMFFNTLTIREDGACRICRYPLDANVMSASLEEIWNSPARWQLYRSLVREGCPEPCWIRCHIHPSAAPGRVLRRAVALLGTTSPYEAASTAADGAVPAAARVKRTALPGGPARSSRAIRTSSPK